MADARLQQHTEQVEKVLTETENAKLSQLGKTREYYENLVDDLGKNIS